MTLNKDDAFLTLGINAKQLTTLDNYGKAITFLETHLVPKFAKNIKVSLKDLTTAKQRLVKGDNTIMLTLTYATEQINVAAKFRDVTIQSEITKSEKILILEEFFKKEIDAKRFHNKNTFEDLIKLIEEVVAENIDEKLPIAFVNSSQNQQWLAIGNN